MNAKTEQGFDRAIGEAKRQAENVAGKVRDSASDIADTAATAVRKSASGFERAARELIENQPYTAVMVALGIGWVLGRTRHPF